MTPTSSPPTTAPNPLPSPPTTAATNPLSPSMMPTSNEVKVIGVSSIPPSAPSAAEIAKLTKSTELVLMPTSSAAMRLHEVASIALPDSVRLKKYQRPTTTRAETPSTQMLCGSSVAPKISSGSSPENAGRPCEPLPSQTWMAPRITSEAPIVTMISVTVSAPLIGSIASFSTSKPTPAGIRIARTSAAGRGRPVPVKYTASIPPSMMNSPWAKLMTLLAL